MKLQTTCASDKAAHINVSVKERVSSEMSISTQRGELGGRRVDEKKPNLSGKDHTIKIWEPEGGTKRTERMNYQ